MTEKDKRYPVICPACNQKIYVAKSFGMEVGWMLDGTGTCIHCNTFLHLMFNPKKKTMTAETFKSWQEGRKR